jgi:hypothetical protein
MGKKSIAVVLIVTVAAGMAMTLRTANRADAAGGDCYLEQGPATPTICN